MDMCTVIGAGCRFKCVHDMPWTHSKLKPQTNCVLLLVYIVTIISVNQEILQRVRLIVIH